MLITRLEDRTLADEQFERRYQQRKQELSDLEVQRARLSHEQQYDAITFEDCERSLDALMDFGHGWDELSREEQQQRLQAVLVKVVVTPGKIDVGTYIDSEEVSRLCSLGAKGGRPPSVK